MWKRVKHSNEKEFKNQNRVEVFPTSDLIGFLSKLEHKCRNYRNYSNLYVIFESLK
ncbi:MAG: hypothetical protein ACP5K8_08190 [Nitrososphaeria archaeon]